ncbi:MAG: hypothetical protein QE487_07240 [Fluviicola sp.]|nr:hypothetical protein [Fluviicola sp.]
MERQIRFQLLSKTNINHWKECHLCKLATQIPMKFFSCLSVLLISQSVIAQDVPQSRLFNEFSVSGNHSLAISNDYPLKNTFGYGASIYHSYHLDRKINPVVGIEYISTHFWMDKISDGKTTYYTDADFYYHQLRIPFSLRFNWGKKSTFFVETGLYLSIVFSNQIIGDINQYKNNIFVTEPVRSKISSNPGIGLSMGIGVQIPLKKKKGSLIFRFDTNEGTGRTNMGAGSPNESVIFYNLYLRTSVIYRLPVKRL